jgi:hypothetical protein
MSACRLAPCLHKTGLIDARLDHGKVEISRRDCLFRTIQLRITGDAIFFDHVLLHFDNGTDQNVVIGRRISSEEREYVINLPGEGRVLESVEFFISKSFGNTFLE